MKTKIFKVIPVPKPRMTRSDSYKKRPIVMKYWAYKDTIKEQQGDFRFPHSKASVTFYMPIPKSWSNKKKDLLRDRPHQKKRSCDIDNLLKAFLDALTWDEGDDDGNIWNIESCSKYWSDDPRIEVKYVDSGKKASK